MSTFNTHDTNKTYNLYGYLTMQILLHFVYDNFIKQSYSVGVRIASLIWMVGRHYK